MLFHDVEISFFASTTLRQSTFPKTAKNCSDPSNRKDVHKAVLKAQRKRNPKADADATIKTLFYEPRQGVWSGCQPLPWVLQQARVLQQPRQMRLRETDHEKV